MMMKNKIKHPASFRDPAGSLFYYEGVLYRQINNSYTENYDLLFSSGLYQKLVEKKYLIEHKEIRNLEEGDVYKIIQPEAIPFISYPYQWCFSQLKEAALLILKIQKIALDYGMSLKDSSAYNIQFFKGRPILIDTLSFEKNKEKEPWIAYKQFCEHFLAPLYLQAKIDVSLNKLLINYIDGIPLSLTNKLLPLKYKFNVSSFIHLYLHNLSQKKYNNLSLKTKKINKQFKKKDHYALISSLESAIVGLKLKQGKTVWTNYMENETCPSYSSKAMLSKKEIISVFLDKQKVEYLWDIGTNNGEFSKLAAKKGVFCLAFDSDHTAIEKLFSDVNEEEIKNILPLVEDLSNPSPSIGWQNKEREALLKNNKPDCIFALALIHHLVITNNLPLFKIVNFFASQCKYIVIEFIPKDDKQIKLMLSLREDIFTDYSQKNFELEFKKSFDIISKHNIKDSLRVLYIMKRK